MPPTLLLTHLALLQLQRPLPCLSLLYSGPGTLGHWKVGCLGSDPRLQSGCLSLTLNPTTAC